MPPVTKIWLFTLLPGNTASDPTFTELWNDIFELVNSYTQNKPSAKCKEQHVLLQDENNPTQLALITGYPSLEISLEADRVYAEKFLKTMFELVKHDRLLMIEEDIDRLPLHNGRVVLSLLTEEPISEQMVTVQGGWDVWQPPGAQGAPSKTTYIGISPQRGVEEYFPFKDGAQADHGKIETA
ncbi:hypothetical protein F5Y16DRAFT_46494 [Xylariaceae sp. FL0255]|nr:hypothetical protein F5Y16DRAFT_46494 [Xylariaceae sp. FL0255]